MKTRLFGLSVRFLALMAVLLTPWAATAGTPPLAVTMPAQAPVETALRNHPLLFVSNTGQFDPRVRYQLRGSGGIWWFTDDALWLTVLEKPSPSAPLSPSLGRGGEGGEGQPRRGVHLKLTFPGMSPTTHLSAADPQPGKTNYFLGQDTSRWHANVPTYGSLRWAGVYPGVNLAFGQTGAGLGLTVESASDAAFASMRLRVEGADGVRVDAGGRLVADTAIGPVVLPPWLAREGTSLRPTVAGDSITFATHPFNPFPESVDSPTSPADDPSDLLYSTYLGGSSDDCSIGCAIALGPDGSIYVTGYTTSTDFPTTPGAFDPSYGGLWDAFVTRLNPDGSALVYSTYLGGGDEDVTYAIAVGASGAAYVTGFTASRDFPTTPGAYQTSCSGSCRESDAFVTKLSPDGSTLVYSTYLGGSKHEDGNGIALGMDGSAYVSGDTGSSDFPVTADAYDPTCGTDGRCNPYSLTTHYDVFVTRLNADGSGLVYSTFLGGSQHDCFNTCAIVLGRDGAMYVTGNTCSSDFPTTAGAYDTSFNGASGDCSTAFQGDAFITKLSADGSSLVFSTFLGGSSDDYSQGIALGTDASVYVAGVTTSTDFPTTPGAFDPTCDTCPYDDMFVTRLSASGSALVYSTFLGGTLASANFGIAVGADGAAYVNGETNAADFPTTPGAFQTTCPNCLYYSDAFVTKLSADGSSLLYSTYLGGTGSDGTRGLALDVSGAAYVTGVTFSTDFPTTPGAYDTSFNGIYDVFISRLSPDLVPMHVANIAPFYRPSGSRYRVGTRVAIQDGNNPGWEWRRCARRLSHGRHHPAHWQAAARHAHDEQSGYQHPVLHQCLDRHLHFHRDASDQVRVPL